MERRGESSDEILQIVQLHAEEDGYVGFNSRSRAGQVYLLFSSCPFAKAATFWGAL